MPGEAAVRRADGLVHPVPVAAIGLLVFNDHVLKAAWPGVLSGKLSDLAGMVFFPLMLQAMAELTDRREPFRPSRGLLVRCAVLTAGVFAATKLWSPAAEAYRVGLGWLQWPFRQAAALMMGGGWIDPARVQLTQDPTDVIAVPCVLIAVAVGWRRTRAAADAG
jgi:hypothetical protein